ncbi:MAG TPA: glycosyltransferase [Longimicrobium sp.]|nr:glycosyltransferase [Longimicrobium sp.]
MAELTADTVLLYYQDFENDKWVPGDRYLKRIVRPLYNRLHSGPKVTGFLVAYRMLVEALQRAGVDVRLNDRALARRHPAHPVGLFGYPGLLKGWKLPNPAVLGVGLFDHPSLAPKLMDSPRNRSYLVSCEWMREMFAPYYGDTVGLWFAGIDVSRWPDTRDHAKDIDVLIYDKIRWERDRYEPELLHPLQARLAERGLRAHYLRYGRYDHAAYGDLLARSRSMIFLCEHETQGLAYQEAMACNVPILAWDNGFWLDPHRAEFTPHPVPASSVPYFSPECGERFRGIADFAAALDRFWSRIDELEPRAYVARELSFERSAEQYLSYYRAAALAPAR